MGDALALAGQSAANQIFNSAFWIISFLPSVVTPLVAQAGNKYLHPNTVPNMY